MKNFDKTYRTTSNENDYCALCRGIIPSGEEYVLAENNWIGSALKRKYHPDCYNMMIAYQPPDSEGNHIIWDSSVELEMFLRVCCSCDNRSDCKILKAECPRAICPTVRRKAHENE